MSKQELPTTRVVLEFKDCNKCPCHSTSPYPTEDSFERPEYWWCNDTIFKDEPLDVFGD
jgi:hypothetical protein